MHLFTALLGFAALAQASQNKPKSYEYIVVGSGPGGGPLAANLARSGHSVLLIDAGDDQFGNENSYMVYNNTPAINDPLTRWDFFVSRDTPEVDAQYEFTTWRQTNGEFYVGLNPPEGAERLGIYYPRAGTIGGCAMHNAASLSLPADTDWEDIVAITGDEEWSVENMRKHFVRLERCNYLRNGSDPSHGFTGYLDTSQANYDWALNQSDLTTLASYFSNSLGGLETGKSLYELLGTDINANDPNRDEFVGVITPHTHSRNGVRSSPLNYIRDTLADARRHPLTVQPHTLVTKVLFSDTHTKNKQPKAIGVEYLQGQSLYSADPRHNPQSKGIKGQAFATREVIIAGGVFNSPQILKLSGIGPAPELKKFGIPVVKHLPGVGTNIKDNYEAILYGTFAKPVTGFFDFFYKTALALRGRDLQFYCGSMNFIGFWPGMPGWNRNEFECGAMQLHPRNVNGTVKLRSTNPRDVPDIHLGFFQEGIDSDIESMSEGINFTRRLFNNLTDNAFTELRPCAPGVECTDAWQKDYLRAQTHSHHASGSCAIGADDDPMAVLDSKFRVRGVRNLRVVDGSAFPVQPGAVPSLSTFIIGEKAFQDIISGL
ncbi:hypothetical protein CEP52_004182 [Fusarium oligoseptatum]|uniref:Glucose-methanol-choline oxidoreductase N-terminal domain-containing protein n=1 Tax=Fusarium oligoseptatum TaxID=2604345 RepID=A0A428U536_9HYPO|nr:hypothetical protein CEP52_004182 [Fusarium oligoseptatum]